MFALMQFTQEMQPLLTDTTPLVWLGLIGSVVLLTVRLVGERRVACTAAGSL
jgi:hypothetical protein